ncbi:carboxypeptidase-like regulatory domain-containing protein [Polaribacter cellanae]|uniref:Carboxypeptidase-like regulatory domain-containing protein n=2 Tax=Polaribacter cellanae TaxID=2818493 RepID=A0A975CT79_9FLAO|nr:carboxypeptidase-like regulatory domain-containing protein [Polaribacter cellanae]
MVSDASGALPGVSIVLEGTTKGTETNFDGKFKFPQPLKKGDVLIFSYIGYKTQKVVIDSKNASSKIVLDIHFKNEDIFLMGAVDVKKIYKSKKKS